MSPVKLNDVVIGEGGLVPIHSLAVPSPKKFPQHNYRVSAIKHYWENNSFRQTKKVTSFGLRVIEDLLDHDCIQNFTEYTVLNELKASVDSKDLPYFLSQSELSINWGLLIPSAREVSLVLRDQVGTPELATYQKLLECLEKLPSTEQAVLVQVVESKIGPIKLLAENLTARTIKYVMSKLKLSNLVALLHQLFRSPSVVGKCTAIWRMLELFDVIWKPVDWTAVSAIIDFFYKVWNYLMEKSRLAVDFAEQGFNWVKAKFQKEPKDEDLPFGLESKVDDPVIEIKEPQANKVKHKTPKIRETKDGLKYTPVILQNACDSCQIKESTWTCTFCYAPGCEDCTDCRCKDDTYDAFFVVDEPISPNNDCLYRAVSKGLGMSVYELKRQVFVSLSNPPPDFHIKFNSVMSLDFCIPAVKEQLKCHVMCENESLLYISALFDTDIVLLTSRQDHPNCIFHSHNDFKRKVYVDYFFGNHFEFRTLPISVNCVNVPVHHYGDIETTCTHVFSADPSSGDDTVSEESCGASTEIEELLLKFGIGDEGRSGPQQPTDAEKEPEADPDLQNKENEHIAHNRSFWELIKNLEGNEIGNRIKDWLEKSFVATSEFFEGNPVIIGVVSLILGLASWMGIAIPWLSGDREQINMIRKFSEASKSVYYAQRGIDGIKKGVFDVFNLCKDVLGISSNVMIRDFKLRVAKAYDQVQSMLALATQAPGKFINDGQKFLEFKKEMESVKEVYMELARMPASPELSTINSLWFQLSKTYLELTQIYNKFMSGLSIRQEPVSIWFWGESDIGKSRLATHLTNLVNKELGESLQVMTLSKGPTFWNTYCQQAHIKIDDFNSCITSEGDVDSLAFFNLMTSAAYNPNMANLQDKNTMANPRFVWVCSNDPTIPLNSCISNIVAFERRRKIFVHVGWPEHEKCPKGNYTCPHWKGKTLENYDHLQLTMCSPMVTKNLADPNGRVVPGKKYVLGKDYTWETKEDMLDYGSTVSINDLVKLIIGMEKEEQNKFATVMKQALDADSIMQPQVSRWDINPTIALVGPPGTGKSHILQKICTNRSPCRHVVTDAGFTSFMTDNEDKFPLVIIDDLSTHVNNPHFKTFMQQVKERYDRRDVLEDLWIMGINMEIIKPAIAELWGEGDEGVEMFLRRLEVFNCTFKNRNRRLNMLRKQLKYTHEDLRADSSNVDKYVKYTHNLLQISQSTVVHRLILIKPKLEEIFEHSELGETQHIKPTTAIMIPITSDKFVNMVNDASVTDVIKLVSGDMARVKSTTLSLSSISAKLFKTIKDLRQVMGSSYDNIEDLLLEIWNKKYAAQFENEVLLLKFTDKTYYIDTTVKGHACGVYLSPEAAVQDAVTAMVGTLHTINTTDLTRLTIANLPPWFTFTGEILSIIFGIGGTVLSAFGSIVEQEEMYKATRFFRTMKSTIDESVDSAMSSSIAKIKKKFEVRPPDLDKQKKPIYKDKPSGFINYDLDPCNEFNAETEAPKLLRRGNIDKSSWRSKQVPIESSVERIYNNNVNRTKPSAQCAEVAVAEKETVLHAKVLQVSTDPQLSTVVQAITPNLCQIIDVSGNHKCYGLFIKNNLFTTVSHLQDLCNAKDLRVKTIDGKIWEFTRNFEDQTIDRLDCMVLDKKFPSKKDITNHLPRDDVAVPTGSNGVLLCLSRTFISENPVLFMRSYMLREQRSICYTGSNKQYKTIAYTGHRTGLGMSGVQTEAGDCGALLLIAEPSWNTGKIIGMHVAASTMEGNARYIFARHYPSEREAQVSFPFQMATSHNSKYVVKNASGEDKAVYPQFVPNTTRLFRNWFPIGEKFYEPAVTSKYDTRNPGYDILFDEAMQWCKERPPINPNNRFEYIIRCQAEYTASILSRNNCKLRVLTKTEALNKMSEYSHSEPINIHTSPGYPYNHWASKSGKQDFISVDVNGIRRFNRDNKYLVQRLHIGIDRFLNEAKGVGNAACIWKVGLKDECKTLKKIYGTPEHPEPTTRTIAMAPLDFQIFCRQYLHAFQSAEMECFNELPAKMGINPLSFDWHALYNYMAEVSTEGVDLDFTGWDFCPHAEIFEYLALYANIVYKQLDPDWQPLHDDARRVIYHHIAKFYMLVGNTVIQATGGVPSGSPTTTPDNTKINALMVEDCYLEAAKKFNPKIATHRSFMEDVRQAGFGDDKIITISSYALQFFDGIVLADYFRKYGFKPTPANKEGEIIAHRPLMEMTFLSRGFKKWHGFVIGPLKYRNLCKPTWWTHDRRSRCAWEHTEEKSKDHEIVSSAYESILYDAALHGREVFGEFRKVAMEAWKITGQRYPLEYEDVMTRLFGETADPTHIRGLTFYDCSEILKMIWHHSVPPIHNKFRNRTSYSFGKEYSYTGNLSSNVVIPKNLQRILNYVNERFETKYNSILVNVYPKGGEIPWHHDDEKDLDLSQGVFGVTVQGDGTLEYKGHGTSRSFITSPGQGYMMDENNLLDYKHRRINHTMTTISFTFRCITSA